MPEELTQFLKYAENSTCENAVTEELRKRADIAEARAADAERKCAELMAIIEGRKA
ncbi:MAG: hypothetical protein IKQ25_05050 [Lachnospiraceae bacterium]|nr:hypothetical protein [Lachnospiraceae bacterium]